MLIAKPKYDMLLKNCKKSEEDDEEDVKESPRSASSSGAQVTRAKALLSYIDNNLASIIDWDEHNRLRIRGKVIEGSDIFDLVGDATSSASSDAPPPIGSEQFYRILREVRTPPAMVFNAHRKNLMTNEDENKRITDLSDSRKRVVASSRHGRKRECNKKWIRFAEEKKRKNH